MMKAPIKKEVIHKKLLNWNDQILYHLYVIDNYLSYLLIHVFLKGKCYDELFSIFLRTKCCEKRYLPIIENKML